MNPLSTAAASAAGWALSPLTRRLVGASRPRRPLSLTGGDGWVETAATPLTIAEGEYALWHGDDYATKSLIGEILFNDGSTVRRRVHGAAVPTGSFQALWTGHLQATPQELDPAMEEVSIATADGETLSAWKFPSTSPTTAWAVHVQGIRTSRLVTLRSVEAARRAGLASLVVTYRGAGDGPPQQASTLGQREWRDLADAVRWVRAAGADHVTIVGWSMGAGVSLEMARQEPALVDDLVLICPATNWTRIVQHGVRKAKLPGFFTRWVTWALSSPVASRQAGLLEPLDFARLNWSLAGALTVPTLVVHSQGDDEIPGVLSREFAEAHPTLVTLVETNPAPHGWEANVDPDTFYRSVTERLEQARLRSRSTSTTA